MSRLNQIPSLTGGDNVLQTHPETLQALLVTTGDIHMAPCPLRAGSRKLLSPWTLGEGAEEEKHHSNRKLCKQTQQNHILSKGILSVTPNDPC